MENIKDRFLRYVAVDTQSDDMSESQPSAAKELDLLRMLRDELQALGVKAELDEFGYVMAYIPSNIDAEVPSVGFIAHVDTAPDASGADIKPQVIEDYDGSDIALKGVPGLFLKPSEFPELLDHKGETIITTDGTTLLGADDKAGVAEIMAAAEFLMTARCNHATLKIGFTPDEEIGRGADLFDVKGFGADYAYTSDGGPIGELEYENFNAAAVKITVHGRNIHPGSAKDKMINSQYIAMEFQGLLPQAQKPEHTEGYEGFFHLIGMEGTVEESRLRYIIRDHDMEKFLEKKAVMETLAEFINKKYGAGTCDLTIRDNYFNMKQHIEPVMYIVDRVKNAMRSLGIEPREMPIRGGTDGARLSYMGLPCPNLCTGGENFHGRFEYVPVEDMEKIVKLLVEILTTAV